MLPLNGWYAEGSCPSAMTRSTASAPVNSMLARVVSKWVLLGTTLPLPPMAWNRMRSAARPWWVGMTCSNGNSSRTASRKMKNEGEPAYDSSPCWMAAHWSRLIAPVPESVSRSMSTSSACSWNRLYAASRTVPRRYSSVVMRSGSTEWMRNGSMTVRNGSSLMAAQYAVRRARAGRPAGGDGRRRSARPLLDIGLLAGIGALGRIYEAKSTMVGVRVSECPYERDPEVTSFTLVPHGHGSPRSSSVPCACGRPGRSMR